MKQIAGGARMGNLYSLSDIPINNDFSLNTNTIKNEKAILWHKRLGHTSSTKLSEMKEKNLVKGLENCVFDKMSICEACIKGKHNRKAFPTSETRSTRLLEIIHCDVCGPMSNVSHGGARFFVTFIDDYSRKIFTFLLKQKSDVFRNLKNLKPL